MAITARHTPVSVVWHALGYERAILLPGHFGNMLLHPGEVAGAKERVRLAYARTSSQYLLDAAKRCGLSVYEQTLVDVTNSLPDGLAQAKERKLGFLALARPRI